MVWPPSTHQDVQDAVTALRLVTVAASDTPSAMLAGAAYLCDGTADEVEIQAALDSLPSTGGVVQLLPGRYTVAATIRVEKHGTIFSGSGMAGIANASQAAFGTRITPASGFTGTEVIRIQTAASIDPVSHAGLRDFTIDGANIGTTLTGVLFRAHTSDITRIRVSRMTGHGIELLGYSTWATYDTFLSRCIISECTLSGLYLAAFAQDVHVVECVMYSNAEAGIRIGAGSAQITGCHTYSNGYGIWFDNNGSRTKIVNHKCEQSVMHGIFFDNTTAGTSDVIISSSNFKNNGQSANNTYDHIYFANLSTAAHSKVTVIGCNFSVASPANGFLPRYCVNAASSASQYLNLVGNNFPASTQVGTAITNVATTATGVNVSGNNFATGSTGRTEQKGSASVTLDASGIGTITLSLTRAPGWYSVGTTVAGQNVAVTGATASALTVVVKDAAGAAVTGTVTLLYRAEL